MFSTRWRRMVCCTHVLGATGLMTLAVVVMVACAEPPGETVVLTITARPRVATSAAVSTDTGRPPAGPVLAEPPPEAVDTRGRSASPPTRTPSKPMVIEVPTAAEGGAIAQATNPVTPAPTAPPTIALDGRPGRLLEVMDGDTLRIEVAGVKSVVRLIGFDTPELDDPAGQAALAVRAREELRRLLADGSVELVSDVELREPGGGRLLRHALRNGESVGVRLARMGLARALPREPNLAYREAIDAAVAEARKAGRGMWAPLAGLEIEVDKSGEVATLRNTSDAVVDLSDWWLVSVRGAQAFRFPPGQALAPGEELRVAAGEAPGDLRFGDRNVWNNSQQDPAELRRPDGRVAATWEDSDLP